MPRFYFYTRTGQQFVQDPDGAEFASQDGAEIEATRVAVQLSRDWLPGREDQKVTVEVRDEHGRSVTIVSVNMQIERARAR